MAQPIAIKHPPSGLVKQGYYGFSWTYLFYGFFVPLFRGEPVIALLHLIFSVLTAGLWQLIVSFLYNKQYMTRMLTAGWVLADSEAKNAIAASKLGVVLAPAPAPAPAAT
jgi:hypothetical protein